MKRSRRRFENTLAAVGVLLLAYAAVTLFWRDPLTDLYARYQQHQLAAALAPAPAEDGRIAASLSVEERRRAVAAAASRYAAGLELGQPLGRISAPRIGLRTIFVHGTRWAPDLSRGPGHYPQTSLPGLGRTTAIAGHRTTFGAPFRKIDDLERGDEITLELPYGTFRYRVFAHEIVANDDWSIIRERGFDTLVLSACHPLYGAEQRWVVYARLAAVDPVVGPPYEVDGLVESA